MAVPEHPTGGATFMVDRKAYRCILVIATMPISLALYECNACTSVITDPRRHSPVCGAGKPPPKLRGVGTAKTIPLPGRPE